MSVSSPARIVTKKPYIQKEIYELASIIKSLFTKKTEFRVILCRTNCRARKDQQKERVGGLRGLRGYSPI